MRRHNTLRFGNSGRYFNRVGAAKAFRARYIQAQNAMLARLPGIR